MKNTIKLVNGGVYTNRAGDTITITHLDVKGDDVAYVIGTAGGVLCDDEYETVAGIRAALKGYTLTGQLAA